MTVQPQQARRGTVLVALSSLSLGVLLVVVALLLSACSGSSSGTTPSSTSTGSTTTAATPTTSGSATATGGTTAPTTSSTGAAGGLPTQAAVPIASPATFTSGITATVISIEPVTATAALPGEISGPAVRLTVAVQNGASAPLDLGNVVVDLQDAAGASATSLSGNGASPLTGTVPPGGSASGAYVFTLAQGDRTGVRLYVTCNASLPVVVFTGDLP